MKTQRNYFQIGDEVYNPPFFFWGIIVGFDGEVAMVEDKDCNQFEIETRDLEFFSPQFVED